MELWHEICKSMGMNKTKFISTILLATAFSFAAGESSAPESYVPTPAEKQEISRETPDLSQKERADWQRMREERKQAREQILSKLREAPPSERKQIRQEGFKNRDEKPRFEGDFPKNQFRERDQFERDQFDREQFARERNQFERERGQFEREPFEGRPDSPNMEPPPRDKPDFRPMGNPMGGR